MVNNTNLPQKSTTKSPGRLNSRLLVMLDDLKKINHHLNVSLGMTQNSESRIKAYFLYECRKKKILDEFVVSVLFGNKPSTNEKNDSIKLKKEK